MQVQVSACAGTWGLRVECDKWSCSLLCPDCNTFTFPWHTDHFQSTAVLSETLHSVKYLPFSPPTSKKMSNHTGHLSMFEPRPNCWLIKPCSRLLECLKHYPSFAGGEWSIGRLSSVLRIIQPCEPSQTYSLCILPLSEGEDLCISCYQTQPIRAGSVLE